MSLEKLLKRVPVGLTALFLSCGSGDGQGGEGAGCTSDYDCKGDRICSGGQCITTRENNPSEYEPPKRIPESENNNSNETTCPQICYSCDNMCTSLIYDDFNESNEKLWDYSDAGDYNFSEGGTLKFNLNENTPWWGANIMPNLTLAGDLNTKLYTFKRYVFKTKVKKEGNAYFYFSLGIIKCRSDVVSYVNEEKNDVVWINDPNTIHCYDQHFPVEEMTKEKVNTYPRYQTDTSIWHEIITEIDAGGIFNLTVDGQSINLSSFNTSFTPPDNNAAYWLTFGCNYHEGLPIGKCLFDYLSFNREN